MRKEFRVSTKIALFDQSAERVLTIRMDEIDGWGLPGGHIEEGETPDETILRELFEECGVKPDEIARRDFFMHSAGKLILAYTGITRDDNLCSQQNEIEGTPKWLTKSEFEAINIEPNYRTFVLKNWIN